jgi:hypothetical protein
MLVAESDLLSYSCRVAGARNVEGNAVLGSALFFVIAPLVLAGFVPWWVTHWEFRPAFFGVDLTRILGDILIIVGVAGLVDSFARFALEGASPDARALRQIWGENS